jgi:putative mRNA 3-end processing factor
MLQTTDRGLYCAVGDFHIDPWQPVARAVVTHAHADHACRGCGRYLTSEEGSRVLRVRMGPEAVIETLAYGERLEMDGLTLSLHPAGHILGSSQVRLEHRGYVAVVSGDYKTSPDATCTAFEPVRCNLFLSESTFGLPIYRWAPEVELFAQVNDWWRACRDSGRAAVLFAYALGKAQRLLAGVDASIGPIFSHGAVEPLNRAYRESGVELPPTSYVSAEPERRDWGGALIVAPPSAQGTPWLRRFGASASTAFASGWMRIRGPRRRRSVDRGFVLSDHADWPGLQGAIDATGAETVWITHGYSSVLARWLEAQGREALVVPTRYEGESIESSREADEPQAEPEGEAP